jgi:hypothetical protein
MVGLALGGPRSQRVMTRDRREIRMAWGDKGHRERKGRRERLRPSPGPSTMRAGDAPQGLVSASE